MFLDAHFRSRSALAVVRGVVVRGVTGARRPGCAPEPHPEGEFSKAAAEQALVLAPHASR